MKGGKIAWRRSRHQPSHREFGAPRSPGRNAERENVGLRTARSCPLRDLRRCSAQPTATGGMPRLDPGLCEPIGLARNSMLTAPRDRIRDTSTGGRCARKRGGQRAPSAARSSSVRWASRTQPNLRRHRGVPPERRAYRIRMNGAVIAAWQLSPSGLCQLTTLFPKRKSGLASSGSLDRSSLGRGLGTSRPATGREVFFARSTKQENT